MKMFEHMYLRSGSGGTARARRKGPSFVILQMVRTCLLAAFVCCSAAACVKPVTLVLQRQSSFSIYHSDTAPESVREAARELQHYVKKVSGADLPITTAPPVGNFIAIGDSGLLPSRELPVRGIPPEGYRIISRNGNFFIVGNDTSDNATTVTGENSTGSLFGTYAFIEAYLGVRWFMPGEVGEYVPRQDSIIIPAVNIRAAPDFQRRELAYIQNQHPDVKVWYRRNRLGGSLRLNHGHYWHVAIPAEEHNRHPDYFAMINGARVKPNASTHFKLCTTNQELIRAYASKAADFFSRSEKNTVYSLSPTDGRGWCECQACRSLDETDKDGNVRITRRILTFYNEVARLLETRFPDRYLCGYVYGDYLNPPMDRGISIHPNVQLVLAANYHRRLFFPEEQREWQGLIRRWTRLKPLGSYYDFPAWFSADLGQPMPPNKKILAYMFPVLKHNDVKGLYMYGIGAWGHGAAFNYIFSRLAWNAAQSVDALYADFFSKCYGRGGIKMRALYGLIEEALEQYCRRNPALRTIPQDDLLREVYAKNFSKIETLYCQALAAEPVGTAHQRIEMFGDNLVVLCRALRLKKLLPLARRSRFYMPEAAYQDFLMGKINSLSLAPEVMRPVAKRDIARASLEIPERKPRQAERLRRYRLRGSQHIVALATFTGPVEILLRNVTILDGLLEFCVYEATGTRITCGATAQDTAITFNVKAGQQYHIYIDTKRNSFMLDFPDGIHYALNGSVDRQGLWLLARQTIVPPQRYVPSLYFHVPDGIAGFEMTLSSHYPLETATANVYDAHEKNVATLSTADSTQNRAHIPCRAHQAGIWRIDFSSAEKGRLEDVWIKFSGELSGYASLEADKMLINSGSLQ